ncbi:MAG TPA: hydroxymethylglutaryl-CoA reductase, degradative [Euryarchaeota archaeon]|nr:MAG: hydroxymethylglutaryl-CoA reductase, degradative [Thermococci archaeon]RLF95793.1 MAG: hydroxymethylglutaryl-CoA reductase, degradative [Thermococci archaeon]HDI10330.1 hydroxymethylglutaryl-CoA reductase, degradative [Euryarchaeota archaeon]
MSKTSRIPGFYKLTLEERLEVLRDFSGLSNEEIELLSNFGNLGREVGEKMIENVVGAMSYPLGIAANFLINGRDYLIPMVLEEPSVVAAASNAAKMTRKKGGVFYEVTDPVMIGQIQVVGIEDPYFQSQAVLSEKEEILKIANEKDPILVKFGGGAIDLETRVLDSPVGKMLVIHLLVDVRDAMGANAVNTMCEAVAPYIEKITGGKVYLRIISNLADKRLVRARTVVDKEELGGRDLVEGIVTAWALAEVDPYRAATHNKGIMNGVIAVALATAQDHRAIEAGAHAYACRFGCYKPLSRWEVNRDGDLVGTLEMPMAVGTVGGATKVHPVAQVCMKILGVNRASELAGIMGSVGLVQNLAALRALAKEGIQRGHMKLHARNIAMSVGAKGELVDKIVEIMVKEGKISYDRAKEIMNELKS